MKKCKRLLLLVLILSFAASFFVPATSAAMREPIETTIPVEETTSPETTDPTQEPVPTDPTEEPVPTDPTQEPLPTEPTDETPPIRTGTRQSITADGSTYYASGSFSESIPTANANATDVLNTLDNQNGIELSAGGDYYTISSAEGLMALAKYSNGNSTAGMVFYISSGLPITLDSTFPGIGSVTYPFAGTMLSSFPTTLQLDGSTALFRYLSSSATLFNSGNALTISAGTGDGQTPSPSCGGLAQVLRTDTDSMTLGSNLIINGSVSNYYNAPSGLSDTGLVFGKVAASRDFTLNISNSVSCTAAQSQNIGDTGSLIGSIDADGYTVTLVLPTVNTAAAVSSQQGDAGSLIGSVNGTLLLDLPNTPISVTGSVTAISGNAGGLVGAVDGTLVLGVSAQSPDDLAITSITGVNAYASGSVGGNAGGLVGMLENGSQVVADEISVSQAHVAGGKSAGSLFGCADCATLDITSAAVTGGELRGDTNLGGVIGTLITDAAFSFSDWMTVSGTSLVPVNGTNASAVSAAGGLFGDITITSGDLTMAATAAITSGIQFDMSGMTANNANLCIGGLAGALTTASRAQTVSVSQTGNFDIAASALTSGRTAGAYGGLIGKVSDNTYFTLQNARVSAATTANDTVNSAGFLGILSEGAVLVCTGNQTVNHKNKKGNGVFAVARAEEGSAVSFGGSLTYSGTATVATVVKYQDNALIYCDNTFAVNRGTAVDGDDIGNYGQIYRNAAIGNIISCNNHTVSVAQGTTAITSLSDFARLAITLSSQGVFSGITGTDATNYAALLQGTISLGANIDLSGSGIESLTRTDSEADKFSGTLQTTDGTTKTVTLAIGERVSATNDGVFCKESEILSSPHKYLGLFASVNGATVQNIAIAGTACCDNSNNALEYVGGLAATATGTVSVTDCTTSVLLAPSKTLDNRSAEDGRGQYGGFFASYDGTSLTITGCTSTANITISTAAPNSPISGGFVGNIDTTSGTFTFTNNTLGAQIGVSGSTQNARVGGFAAVLDASGTATVTATGLSSAATAPANIVRASASSGGLLGYNWNNVDATIDGTVNGTVNVTNKGSFGGLLYQAKGKVTLNNTFTMTGSYTGTNQGTRSDGLIVCMGEQLFLIARCPYENLEDATITNATFNRVDRLVGNNITEQSANGVAEQGGIVSIETGEGTGVMPAAAPGTDWYNAEQNPKTRYYYNIAALANQTVNTQQISTASDLLLWHLNKYSSGNIVGFKQSVGNTLRLQSSINVSGLCLYPTSLSGNNVSGSFDFAGNRLTFGLPAQEASIDETISQNYAAQTGLLLDVSGSLSLSDAEFSGTVSHLANDAGSGAFVVGALSGHYTNAANPDTPLSIDGVVLNNLKVDNAATADYAPLLINRIIESIDANITDISQSGYTAGTPAASSLIGYVGTMDENNNITSSYLNFLLGNIVLDTADASTVFTNSSLFERLLCTSGTGGFHYNFNIGEDWTSASHLQHVTYGSELTADRTEYYDVNKFVSPVTNPVNSPLANVYDFSGYIPYVADATGNKLIVNLKSGDLIDGWGTFAHPYRITSANQLIALDTFLSNGTASSGWQIRYHDDSGNYGQGDIYTYENGAVTPNTATVAELRAWLQEAYFLIDTGEIDLSSANFTGIGTDTMPFHGVITGNNARIVLPANNDLEAGGFIKVANGCVIKGLTVAYSGQTSISVNEDSYFGGVIGKIIGGDNIIDSVSVNGLSTGTTENLTLKTRVSFVGGYVGCIFKGGLLLRGTNEGSASYFGNAAYDGYFYAAPYLGRVIDGYAFNENTAVTLNNTDKNYRIVNLAPSAQNSIVINTAVSPATVSLDNADELFLFASAVNSNSLSFNNPNSAYTEAARVRAASYTGIGTSQYGERIADDSFSVSNTVPYLVDSYFANDSDKTINAGTKTLLQVVFSGITYDLTAYGNGFRGIGGQYFSTPTLLLNGVAGNGATIRMQMNRQQYFSSTYETYSSGNIGLFNYVAYSTANSDMLFEDLTLCGTVSLQYASSSNAAILTENQQLFRVSDNNTLPDDFNNDWYKSRSGVCAGALIGKLIPTASSANDVLFENIQLGTGVVNGTQPSLSVVSQDTVGGMIGYIAEDPNSTNSITIADCSYNGLQAAGKSKAGGLVGFARLRNTIIQNTDPTALLQNADITVKRSNEAIRINVGNNDDYRMKDVAAGGVIGFCYGHKGNSRYVLVIEGVQTSKVNVLSLTDGVATVSNTGAGGIIGRTDWLSIGMEDVSVTDTAVISGCGKFVELATYSPVNFAALQSLGEYRNYADWLLSLSSSNYGSGAGASFSGTYLDGAAGGVIGSLGCHPSGNAGSFQTQFHCVTLRDVSVAASAEGASLVAGYNCGGGLVGDNRTKVPTTTNMNTADDFNTRFPRKATLVVEGCSVGASGGPVIILGGTRAGGVFAYGNQELGSVIVDESENNLTQIGSHSSTVYILGVAANNQSVAGGVVGDTAGNVTVSDTSVIGARLSGRVVAGILGKLDAAASSQSSTRTVTVSDSSVDGAWLYNYSRDSSSCCGGIFATTTSASGKEANCYFNRVTLKDCTISRTTENASAYTGGLSGHHNSKLYGNQILWRNNQIGSTTVNFATNGNYKYLFTATEPPTGLTNGSNGRAGVWVGKASSASFVRLLGVSRLDTSAAPLTVEIKSGTPAEKAIVYAAYNVAAVTDIDTQPSVSAGGQTWSSDAVGYVNSVRTPAYQNASISWWKSGVKMTQAALTAALSTYGEIDETALADVSSLPLFLLSGNVSTVLPQYLNLMTNAGFGEWNTEGLAVSYDSRQYTVTQDAAATTLTMSADSNSGSVVYDTDSGLFKNGNQYDIISDNERTFTVLTVTFTNPDSGDSDYSYSMDLLLYYPQVLQMNTHVMPLAHEEYGLSNFFPAGVNTFQTSTNADGTLSLYLEYVYNEIRSNNTDWNFDKVLRSMNDTLTEAGTPFPAGTVLTLIDLNSATPAGYQAYYQTLAAASTVISFTDFETTAATDNTLTYIPLSELTSLTGKSAFGSTGLTSAQKEVYGLERYLMILEFPDDYSVDADRAAAFYLYADAEESHNVTIERERTGTNRAFVTVFAKTALAISGTPVQSQITNSGTATAVSLTLNVTYPLNYVESMRATNPDLHNYGVVKFFVRDSGNREIPLPVGTEITVLDSNRNILQSYSLTEAQTDNSFTLNGDLLPNPPSMDTYTVELDFSRVSAATYNTTFPDSTYFFYADFYLTDVINRPESGDSASMTPHITLPTVQANTALLAVQPTGDTLTLGVNFYNTVDDPDDTNQGRIAFDVIADFTGVTQELSNCVLSFRLLRKMPNGSYQEIPQSELSQYLTSLTCNGVSLLSSMQMNVQTEMADDKMMTKSFVLQVNPAITYFANYKLEATLTADTNANTVTGINHLIYTVAKIKNVID